jgi:heme oxygenase
MSLRTALRAGTSDCHADVDEIFGRFDLAREADYKAFLSAHARAVPAVETALESAGIERLIPDWKERRRRDLLLDDLASMDAALPPSLDAPGMRDDAALLGAVYVLEGSKLGGAMLAKSVGEGLPSAYLSPFGPKGGMKAFMDMLEASGADEAAAVEAARAVFALFHKAAAMELEMTAS